MAASRTITLDEVTKLSDDDREVVQQFFLKKEKEKKAGRKKFEAKGDKHDLFFLSVNKVTNVSSNDLEEAQETKTPLLVKDKDGFHLYGDKKGDGNWVFTKINSSSPEVAGLLNRVPFEKKMMTLSRERSTRFASLIDIIGTGHTPRRYPFQMEGKSYLIQFADSLFRAKKPYRKIVEYKAEDHVLLQQYRKKNTLYLRYNVDPDGSKRVDVFTHENKDPTTLSATAWYDVENKWRVLDGESLNGCNVFFMKTSADNIKIKSSDRNNLYLYRNNDGKLFYRKGESAQKHIVDPGRSLPKFLFDQPSESPKKSELTGLCKVILRVTSSRLHNRFTADHLPPDPKIIARKKMSVLMSACGDPINRFEYRAIAKQLGKGSFGEVSKSPYKWVHSDNGMVRFDSSDQHLRKGCRVFLMKMPENDAYQESSLTHLYLYQKENGEIFYRKKDNPNPITLAASDKNVALLNSFREEKFDQTEASPQTLKNRALREAVLDITSAKGDTHPANMMVDRTSKVVKMQNLFREADPGEVRSPALIAAEERARLEGINVENEVVGQVDGSHVKKVTTAGKETFSVSNEYVGQNMTRFLKENKLEGPERYELSKKLLEAMEAFHKTGFVHRDIKRDNIMVYQDPDTKKFVVKIIDLGFVSKEYDAAYYTGSPDYMPPEIHAEANNLLIMKQHDIYSMGMVLRGLWEDSSLEDRSFTVDALGNYRAAMYFLNIPMKPAVLNGNSEDEGMKRLGKVMNGMTATRPTERLSARQAKCILQGEPAEKTPEEKAKEEKEAEFGFENVFDKKAAADCLARVPFEQKLNLYENVKVSLALLKREVGNGDDEKRKAIDAYIDLLILAEHEDKVPVDKTRMIILMSKFLFDARQKECDFSLLKKDHDEFKSHLGSYGHFLRKAWDETFLPGMTDAARVHRGGFEYFLGVPSWKKQPGAFIASLVLGWAIHTAKSIIKLPELILEGFAQLIAGTEYKIKQTNPTSTIGKGMRELGMGVMSVAYLLPEGLRLLTRIVTSPVASFRAAWKAHPLLGVASAVLSLGAFGLAGFLAFPIVGAAVLGAIGVTMNVVVTAAVGGAVIVAPVAFNEAREWQTEKRRAPDVKQKAPESRLMQASRQSAPEEQKVPLKSDLASTGKVTATLSENNGVSREAILHARYVAANAKSSVSASVGRESQNDAVSQVETPAPRVVPRSSRMS